MKHKISIRKPTDDQRLVSCSCGFKVWCLYAYEARGEKEIHLNRMKERTANA